MSPVSPPSIEIRSLFKVFGDNPSSVMPLIRDGIGKDELLREHGHVLGLRDINLSVPPQGVQVVMGLSGCGKSTLIRHLNRLVEPTEGEIRVGDVDVLALDEDALRTFRRHRVSMVFQSFALFPHKTVQQNVAYGLETQGVPPSVCDERAQRWIERVGLAGYEKSHPPQLSGGMQQRVGIARALATDAPILLLDEPFSALDPLIRADMRKLVMELQRELKKTVVFVTHDLEEAIEIGDRIAILRDGEIIQDADSQEIVLQPANDFIAEFTRSINRGRVLRVASVMEPLRPGLEGPPECPADMLLQDALPLVSATPLEEAPVVDAAGKPIGSLSVIQVLLALAGSRFAASATLGLKAREPRTENASRSRG